MNPGRAPIQIGGHFSADTRPHMLKTRMTLALMLLSGSWAAQAYFENKATPPPPPEGAQPVQGYTLVADRSDIRVVYIGSPDPATERLPAGQSYGVPLEAGLKLLLPSGWHGYVKEGLDSTMPVRWTNTAGTWVEALRQISNQTSTSVTVDWARRTVFISPLPAASSLATSAPESVGNPMTAAGRSPAQLAAEEALEAKLRAQQAAAMTSAAAARTYPNLDALLKEPVSVDLRNATLREAISAVMPAGWQIEIDDNDPYLQSVRLDVTAPGPRGEVMRTLVDSVGLVVYPYPELNKAVVDKVAKK